MSTEIVVPELGESVVEATVGEWRVKVGDPVKVGDIIVELETDKVDIEVGATTAGTITQITHPAGSDVKIGDVLGSIDANGAAQSQPADASEKAATRAEEAGPSSGKSTENEKAATPVARRMAEAEGIDLSPEGAEMVDQATEAQRAGQQVIHSGDATLVVDDPTAASEEVRDLAERLGGYVDSQTVSEAGEDSRARATLSIRVPADKFDAAFDALGDVGEVVNQSRSATDVTLQYVDLEARVDALQGSVDRLTELMSGAATTGELIEAEAALSQRCLLYTSPSPRD